MVLRDGVVEQHIKPVCVPVFCLAQIGVACFFRVGQAIRARRRVVGIDEVVHFSIYTAVRGTVGFGQVQVAGTLHFAVNAHLVLRVHDVEVTVAGLHAHGKFTGIADFVVPGASFLGRHHNHTGHGARTVNRCGRTVLQDLETLDVIGVQTGDGRRNQRFGITRRQGIGIHFGHIFHDDAVHHPQRLRAAINRSSTAHTDLGRRTKCTRHVLHGHTGYASFQGTADLGDTVQLGFIG